MSSFFEIIYRKGAGVQPQFKISIALSTPIILIVGWLIVYPHSFYSVLYTTYETAQDHAFAVLLVAVAALLTGRLIALRPTTSAFVSIAVTGLYLVGIVTA